jgi:DNA-directed RNA polymerase subunit RPC12/RpoP
MREKIMRFMAGRYGTDAFSKFLLILIFICLVLNLFLRIPALYFLGLVFLVYCYFRMFSRNYAKRSAENAAYLKATAGLRRFLRNQQTHFQIRKTHHLYKCRQCGKYVKVPKGKGRIEITCPSCRYTFIKKS